VDPGGCPAGSLTEPDVRPRWLFRAIRERIRRLAPAESACPHLVESLAGRFIVREEGMKGILKSWRDSVRRSSGG